MIICKYELRINSSSVTLSANASLLFDKPGSETINFGTPKCFDNTLIQRLAIEEFSIIHICSKFIAHGFYNSITDYKGIWNMIGLSRGEFDGSYITKKGKVYFGIKCGKGKTCFFSDTSAIMLLVPNELQINNEDIFQRFKKNKVDFSDRAEINKTLHELVESCQGTLAIHYDVGGERAIDLFGIGCKTIFKEDDFKKWPTHDPELIYRKGLV